MSLLQQYREYIESVRTHARILPYRPPCCDAELEMRVPEHPGEVWDSLINCPNCGTLAMKELTYDTVKITLLEAITNEEK